MASFTEHPVELFGGAMRVSLPTTMTDVSQFRQVPDNQEVYVDAATGTSVIVELLSRERCVSNAEADTFFYRDLAKDNGCALDDVQQLEKTRLASFLYPHFNPSAVPPTEAERGRTCDYACLTTGLQRISKYTNENGRENLVFVGLVVLRFLPPVSTEMLVSVSSPVALHPESSEARVIERLLTTRQCKGLIGSVLMSLEVVDWGLFVPEE